MKDTDYCQTVVESIMYLVLHQSKMLIFLIKNMALFHVVLSVFGNLSVPKIVSSFSFSTFSCKEGHLPFLVSRSQGKCCVFAIVFALEPKDWGPSEFLQDLPEFWLTTSFPVDCFVFSLETPFCAMLKGGQQKSMFWACLGLFSCSSSKVVCREFST